MIQSAPDIPAVIEEQRTDKVHGNPFLHFILSEIWTGFSGFVVYLVFLIAAYGVQYANEILPLNDPSPAIYLGSVISWAGAICSSVMFVVITIYQVFILIRRLREKWHNERSES